MDMVQLHIIIVMQQLSCKGHLEVVKYLISLGVDINKSTNYGSTPLYIASCKGHLEVVKYLISLGVDINKANNSGTTLFYIATCQ
jgi:ankyrin repeat protein